jgi:hypothetical protein
MLLEEFQIIHLEADFKGSQKELIKIARQQM